MNKVYAAKNAIAFPLVLALALFGAACENPVEDHDDHEDAAGVVVEDLQGNVLARVDASRNVTGGITLQSGQQREVRVTFLADDGDRIVLEDEFGLDATVANTGVATWTQIAHTGGRLAGTSVGSTTITFDLTHGGHPDYTSPAIPVTVTQ